MDHYANNIISSSISGLIISIILIRYFGAGSHYLGTIFENTNNNNNESEEPQQLMNTPQINVAKAIKKLNPFKKYLGLSDKEMKDLIDETNEEINLLNQEPKQNDRKDSSKFKKVNVVSSISHIMDIIVIISAITLICYSLNTLSHGSLIRVLIGVFPIEAKTLRNITMKFYNLIHP